MYFDICSVRHRYFVLDKDKLKDKLIGSKIERREHEVESVFDTE